MYHVFNPPEAGKGFIPRPLGRSMLLMILAACGGVVHCEGKQYTTNVIPANAGIQYFWLLWRFWIPASAGMTGIFTTLHP
jgi:hypothetical protein